MSKYTSDASSSSPTTRGSSLTTTVGSPLRDEGLELKNMAADDNAAQSPPSIHTDVMQLARLGEIGAIQKLYESGQVDPKYKDDEGLTPLHWAAINNRYELCRYLLEAGADVDAKGGDSIATPAMWAAQRCHYYIVHLLLKYGADPLLTDAQGYNLLHLASIDGNAFLLALLLHQEIPVDVLDPQGHTALMWAAYKGFPICVDLFLRWGADVNAADDAGFSPIHWALVRGSGPCIQKILEYGADRFAKTKDGKTPAVVAEEMKSKHLWRRALRECGYDYDGNTRSLPVGLDVLLRKRTYVSRFFLLLPFFAIPTIIFILSNLPILLSIPVTLIFLYVMQRLIKFVAARGPAEFRVLQRTPLLAGVFAGSLFWVGIQWVLYILPATYSSYLFSNIIFLLFYGATTYFYAFSMIENPGFIPKSTSRDQQRAVITELFDSWTFDEDHFCVYCMTRKPLRSKHCRQCKRCVSKHDHHCPWVNNCVGTNNFRHFVMYILTLEVGILIYIFLTVSYFSTIPAPENAECSIISSSICSVINRDPFTFLLSVWTSFQLIWVTMLCVVQLIQISRNQTTYENMKGTNFDDRPRVPPGHVELGGAAQPTENAGEPRQRPHKHGLSGCLATWKQLLGLNAFMATAQDGLGSRSGPGGARKRNPFSHGVIGNCRDFWCDPAPYLGRRDPGSGMLGGQAVNYYNLYDMDFAMRMLNSGGGGGSRVESGMTYARVATEDAGAMA